MKKQRVLLTGASGAMGFAGLNELLKDTNIQDIVILVRPSDKNKKTFRLYEGREGLTIYWGDLTNYDDVYKSIEGVDIILHVAAFVSPAADNNPEMAMKINYGSAKNLVKSIEEQGRKEHIKFVNIGTIAETGDRMPPIHWGRIGDSIKPSVYDYYAVSKIAAERLVIESGIKNWVSLRQTGILGNKMMEIEDPIQFHNCYDNVLEYVSDKDSARMLKNLCAKVANCELSDDFWGHLYNVGGGESCRTPAYEMMESMYKVMGINDLSQVVLPAKYQCLRNFHGTYYLDSDKLNYYLEFRGDTIEYNDEVFAKSLGDSLRFIRLTTKIPGGQKIIGRSIKKHAEKLARMERGPIYWEENCMEEKIAAYYGSVEAFEKLPESINDLKRFSDWDKVVHIDHGYDEIKPEGELNIADVRGAANFRGGECLSDTMKKGDWISKLKFKCAFGHEFEASPRLVLEGGHWCPVCERESWNYYERAKVDPFFAQVWKPLHDDNEKEYVWLKEFSELDID